MHRLLTAAALFALSACGPQQAPAPETNAAATAEAKPPKAEVPSLEGEWNVTRVDGRDSAGLGIVATLRDGRARLATGCLHRAWTFSQDRNMVSFTSFPAGSSNCGQSPSVTEEVAYAALDKANMVIFARDGRQADLSGLGGNLTLERR